MQNLFIYGTLQFLSILKTITGKTFVVKPAVLNGFKRYRVKNAEYPAIIPNAGSKISGYIVEMVDDISLNAIDNFEGVEYEKREVTITVNGKYILGLTYVWIAGSENLDDYDWDMSYFEKKYLKFYVDELSR